MTPIGIFLISANINVKVNFMLLKAGKLPHDLSDGKERSVSSMNVCSTNNVVNVYSLLKKFYRLLSCLVI